MDATLRNTPALISHIDKLTAQLVTRFVNIVDLAKPATKAPHNEEDEDENDAAATRDTSVNMSQAASNTFRMEVETAALIRASEDILTLTRQMKEMWLFGQLNTLGGSGQDGKVEEDVRAVVEMLARLNGEGEENTALMGGDVQTRNGSS